MKIEYDLHSSLGISYDYNSSKYYAHLIQQAFVHT